MFFIHFRRKGTHLVGYMIQHAMEDLFLEHGLLLEHLLASMEQLCHPPRYPISFLRVLLARQLSFTFFQHWSSFFLLSLL
jgi:hypothetical protein